MMVGNFVLSRLIPVVSTVLLLYRDVSCDCLLPTLPFPGGNVTVEDDIDIGTSTMADDLTILNITCNHGYLLIGEAQIQCIDDEWSSEIPFCIDNFCEKSPLVDYATVMMSEKDAGIGSKANYTCMEGYELVDPHASTLVCSLNLENKTADWTGEKPVCADTICDENLPVVANATVMMSEEDSGIGSLAKYTCMEGYELVNPNESTLVCSLDLKNKTANWIGNQPVCAEKLNCTDPGVSPNGSRDGKCCSSGDTLHFNCSDDHELVGQEEITCQIGLWTAKRPLCRPLDFDYCPFLDPIPHGFVKARKEGDYFLPGDKAEVVCQPGYRCEIDDVAICENGGLWNKKLGNCKEVFCDPPPSIEHGTIVELQSTNVTQFKYGFDINYVCDKGYRIIRGDISRICIKKGEWSGENPVCGVIRCPDPGTPENGHRSSRDTAVGSRVQFSCDSGYELLGAKEILCQSNGKWAGELTRCNLPSNYCPDPGTPIMGWKSKSVYKMGDSVRFKCYSKTFMVGSKIRQCLNDSTWSGKTTKCVGIYDFDNPSSVMDRLVTRMSAIREHQRQEWLQFEKEKSSFRTLSRPGYPGVTVIYFAFDVSGSISQSHFKKSIKFAKAIVKEVGVSMKTRVGAITFAANVNGIFLPLHFESVNDVLLALDDMSTNIATGGSTSVKAALTFIRKEYIPLVQSRMNNTEIKSVIFLLTDGRANMGGDPQTESDRLKSAGVSIYCIGITGNTDKRSSELMYAIASRSEEEDKPYVFMLQDYKTLSWLVTEIAHGKTDYSVCGVGKENVGIRPTKIVGGQKVKEPWPWMAALNMTRDQNEPVKKVMCGGSIVHQHFILTAAHCLFFQKTGVMRQEGDITVKLGIVHLQDKTYLQEFQVRKIHVHKKFEMATLDYDIALLELNRSIEFNEFVRPICLPPKEPSESSTFYHPDSIVWIAGWGHVNMRGKFDLSPLRMTQHLKEIALPVKPWETCKESLRDDPIHYDRFSERMFCAGTGGERNDTCGGDSGGAVMHFHLNSLGYASWTQVGIVSWGLGCGLEGEYGMYVHLQKLMPWLERTIQDAEKHGNLNVPPPSDNTP